VTIGHFRKTLHVLSRSGLGLREVACLDQLEHGGGRLRALLVAIELSGNGRLTGLDVGPQLGIARLSCEALGRLVLLLAAALVLLPAPARARIVATDLAHNEPTLLGKKTAIDESDAAAGSRSVP